VSATTEEDEAQLRFLAALVGKARQYASSDPEVALNQARKAAEAICRQLFQKAIGEPGKIMLDAMLQKLSQAKVVPQKILVPFGTIQAYGNYGTHAQSDLRPVDADYVRPCLAALDQVVAWYFDEHLGRPFPDGTSAPAAASPTPIAPASRRAMVALLGVGVVLGVVGVAFLVLRHPAPAPPKETIAEPVSHPADAAAPPAPIAARKDLTIQLNAVAERAGTVATLLPGESLRKGDGVAFELQASLPAYLYLVQLTGASGELNVLFPDPAIAVHNPIAAGGTVRIPDARFFVLDDHDIGTEQVYIIASTHEIPQLDAALGQLRGGHSPSHRQEAIASLSSVATAQRPDCKGRKLSLAPEPEGDPCPLGRGLKLPDAPTVAGAHRSSLRHAVTPGDDTLFTSFSFRHVR
jgi:hypothetical protein